jgi:hypothetical protein
MSFEENSKFVLLENEKDSVGNEPNQINETHYKGGIKFQTIGGNREHENRVVPFSLAFQSSTENERYQGGYHHDIQVLPEELHNKLFFSVANEMNSTKNNRKTLKKKN